MNITRVSVDSTGNQAPLLFSNPSVSPAGQFAGEPSTSFSFSSHTTDSAGNQTITSVGNQTTTPVGNQGNQAPSLFSNPSVSPAGQFAGEPNTSFSFSSHTTDSAGNQGNQAPLSFSAPSASPDRQFVGEPSTSFPFSSDTTNLVPRDTNNNLNVFVSDTSKITDVNPSIAAPPINRIEGLPGDDTLTGTNNLSDEIRGKAGNDVLRGLKGQDFLYGDDGNDILYGGKSYDHLHGGLGNDTLVGGAAQDIYYIAAGSGTDTILDFANSEDLVELAGFTFDELLILPGTNGTLITAARSGEILASLIGVPPNLIGREDFSFGLRIAG